MLSLEIMPPLMFGGLVVFLLMGFPVAFSLSAVGLFFGFLSIELGFFNTAYLGNLPLRVFGILSNDLLLAIPFFTFMGLILERSGMAEDLLDTIGQLFGPMRGGLAFAALTALLPLLLLPSPASALLGVLFAALATLWLARMFQRQIGGYTGDCLGATQQLAEVAFYGGLLCRFS